MPKTPKRKTRTPPLNSSNELNRHFLAAWRKGASEDVRLKFQSEKILFDIRYKMQVFRLEYKNQNLPGWEELYKATSRIDPEDPCILIIGPSASKEILSVFDTAGVFPSELEVSNEPIFREPAKKPNFQDELEDFFSSLKEE